MRLLLFYFMLSVLLILGYAVGQEIDWEDINADEIIDEIFDEEGNLKPEYWEIAEGFDLSDAPQEVVDLIDGERSNIVVELENGEEVTIGIAVEDGKIKEVKKGGIENPTSEINTSEETIREITTAEDPATKFSESFAEGEIHYESKSEETWLKGLFINIIAFFLRIINSITSFFSSLFK